MMGTVPTSGADVNQLDRGIGAVRPVRVLGQLGRAARSARITPELAWVMASPRYRADPYPAYRRLRRLDPVHLSPLGVLVVSEHRHVTAALRNPALSVDVTRIDGSALHLGPLRHLLGRADATEHGPFFDLLPELMLSEMILGALVCAVTAWGRGDAFRSTVQATATDAALATVASVQGAS